MHLLKEHDRMQGTAYVSTMSLVGDTWCMLTPTGIHVLDAGAQVKWYTRDWRRHSRYQLHAYAHAHRRIRFSEPSVARLTGEAVREVEAERGHVLEQVTV